jgi:peptide/nickel transport system substrate-binding protein
MAKFDRLPARLPVAIALSALTLGIAACGGGSSNSSTDTGGSTSTGGSSTGGNTTGVKEGGSITYLMGTAPDHVDPQEEYTTQAAEMEWVMYTGLLTYKHAGAEAGGTIIPGLAEGLPTVSSDGKTYTLTLRKGLVFSNGAPVKASDFAYTVKRMLKRNWGGKSFFTSHVVGATAYDTGKAKEISGITTDDATGKITIKLISAYGAFSNVIAFPELGLIPSGTSFKDLSANPPPGVGPYMFTKVVPNQAFTIVKNPKFAALKIPDIPVGHLDTINVKIVSNTQSEAQQVLAGQADVFDAGDTVPPALLQQITSQASDRFAKQTVPSTFYMFLNTQIPPFNNEKAREAVNVGVDRRAFQRLASGFLAPGCYFLPDGITGHPTGDCKFGTLGAPDLAKAKQLLKDSGQMGAKVTVWGEEREPRKEYVDYYTAALNKIGFNATEKIIADATYFPTIGNIKGTNAQTGFADWIQDFPNPSDFMFLLNKTSIQPTNNENFSLVSDPFIQKELSALDPTPATELASVASRWQKLDEYVASKAYVFVYGSEQVPQFYGPKINKDAAVFHRTYFNDFTSLALK